MVDAGPSGKLVKQKAEETGSALGLQKGTPIAQDLQVLKNARIRHVQIRSPEENGSAAARDRWLKNENIIRKLA